MALARLSKSITSRFPATSPCLTIWRQTCSYHSYEYVQPPPFPPAESAILSAAISHVPNYGFTSTALNLGARDAGYLEVSTNLLPRGVFDLINYHLVTQRLALKDTVQFPSEGEQGSAKKLGVGAKVRTLTLARLRANQPIIHRWQEALAVMAQPSYVPTSVAELARLADEIWFLAGDVSVDTSWYTKRASLSAIYSATEVFMTQDRSEEFTETEEFLDSRLNEVMKVGGFLGGLGEWLDYTGHSAVNILRSKGVRI
ncbi:ubiquinone biosynthesis protein COQ9 [Lindgomyces ingoldianus]|uniref:Ubiquinone biosynthesis protein COQ9 n=1 Tax=Lindgomyces ingoldianus TaxID=673940 RepID=A0ACB6RFH0_9PLEO|nr:ubiquinone biosynthesis protein COQ9 [Lindgomyces ingoldianus]KAF2477857.1 ubiquinone biosynthesis protein COQ9 [Lindgomyces ingoldianus]